MIPSFASMRVRRFGLALILLAVPACGLSDYEALMRQTQEREERFREEQKYLGKPVQIPMQKDKDNHDVAVANAYFKPPKGIDTKPQQRGDLMWQYRADPRGSDFLYVELAFGESDKDFAQRVMNNYEGGGQATSSTRQYNLPGQSAPVVYDVWEFSSGQNVVSINVLRGSSKPVAAVYVYSRSRHESARKAIELSLQTLGVDQGATAARKRSDIKSPWKLEGQSGS